MSIFSALFTRKLTHAQAESVLNEIQRLSRLQCPFPAMVRLQILAEKAPRSLIGPGGPLHDRFFAIGLELARGVGSRPNQIVQIAPAWDALPNVLHASVDFAGNSISPSPDRLLRTLSDETNEFVALSNANPNVRERDPERQMRIFFDLVENPSWSLVLLIFSGSMVVRSSVIREHPASLSQGKLQELFPELCSAAENEGVIKIYR